MVQSWMGWALDREADTPLYLQLKAHIEARIDDGTLPPGEQLPATRELALRLGVNRNTVASAYDALAQEGRVHSHVGQGTFVATPLTANGKGSFRWPLSRAAVRSRERVRAPVADEGHPDPVDFASLVPDEKLFPVGPFREVLDDVLAREGRKLLQYGPPTGHPPLRRYIADRLSTRGFSAEPENVLVVNGSQQALDLVCRTLLDPGDLVVVESPTYTIVLPLLAQYQAEVAEVPMTANGLDLDGLENVLARSRPKFLFTMPTFHNPTGITLDRSARMRLLRIARAHDTPVIEDDFDSELRYQGEPVPPLAALDEDGAVLHIGTFSKGLFPGVRLGWIVAPTEVVEALGRSKLIADYHTSLLLQAAVLAFCERGHYDEHLERLAGIYREKSRALIESLERHLPDGVTWTTPEGGFAFWLTLPEGISAEALLTRSRPEGVVFTPGSYFFAGGGGDRYLRLSISRVALDRIEPGVAILGRLVDEALGARGRARSGSSRREPEPAVHI